MHNADTIAAFTQALEDAGIILAKGQTVIPDGHLHRARADGDKAGARSIWYSLHLDAPVAGAAGDWRKGVSTRWTQKDQRRMTQAEREILRQRIELDRKAFDDEQARRHEAAAIRADEVLNKKCHLVDRDIRHPYLIKKHIVGTLIRQIGDTVVLPITDFDGTLTGVQYIAPDGSKKFTAGMKKRGCFIICEAPPEEGSSTF